MTKEQLIILLKTYKENKAKQKLKSREKINLLSQLEILKTKNNIKSILLQKEELKKQLIETENIINDLNIKIEEVEIRLESLRKKEKEILIDYYVEGNTYEQIGNYTYYNLYGQTRSDKAIQKIIEKATQKMVEL